MKLDHFFTLTAPGAPEANALLKAGLVEGTSNDHPGQGTANRRFFFANTALELLYVRDAAEADQGPGRGLRLPERASNAKASPFGLIFSADPDSTAPTFDGWQYQPDYFESGKSFLIGENSDVLSEPLCIQMPGNAPPLSAQRRSEEPFTVVTGLTVSVPVAELSDVLMIASEVDGLSIRPGDAHLMEIVFNDRTNQCSHDFRPELPLVLHW